MFKYEVLRGYGCALEDYYKNDIFDNSSDTLEISPGKTDALCIKLEKVKTKNFEQI